MDLTTITQALRNKVGEDCGLNAVLKFDCAADGVVVVDAVTVPNTVSNEDREAQCTISISLDHLNGLLKGELNPMTAFMTGKIKVAGDMGVAMKLQSVV